MHKQVKTDLFRKFLMVSGCEFIRTKGGHEIWSKPGLTRPIVFRGAQKEIPYTHIKSNLNTLAISVEDFERIIDSL